VAYSAQARGAATLCDARLPRQIAGGAAGVLKPRSYADLYNELDGDIVNLLQRDSGRRLGAAQSVGNLFERTGSDYLGEKIGMPRKNP
jgi:hypothetical protein